VKFVICSREDYDWSKAYLREHALTERCQVLFSPSYTEVPPTGRSRTGFLPIGCPCDFNCSSTRCCGATCRANEAGEAAVVLLSGGLDSATVLAIARAQGFETLRAQRHYGQRHTRSWRRRSASPALGAREHRVMSVDLAGIGGSALTDAESRRARVAGTTGIPVTYVPARNTLLLSLALGWAEVIGAADIFVGVNAIDYSGYPDCRPQFIAAFEQLAQLATKAGVEGTAVQDSRAPDPHVQGGDHPRGPRLGVDYAMTVSCYQASARGAPAGAAIRAGCARSGLRKRGSRIPRATPEPVAGHERPRRKFGYDARLLGTVAQLVEQGPFKALVLGSSPSRPTLNQLLALIIVLSVRKSYGKILRS
jgi:7-cyano-7-deazaguanine synthase